jgi:hypothetical protein
MLQKGDIYQNRIGHNKNGNETPSGQNYRANQSPKDMLGCQKSIPS